MNNDSELVPVFQGLIGLELSGVVFVRDYLQLQFDSAIMTFNIFPKLALRDATFVESDEAYRNRLCGLIGHRVVSAIANDSESIFSFDDGSQLAVSRTENVDDLPELISFDDVRTGVIVW